MDWEAIIKNTKLELRFKSYVERIICKLDNLHYNQNVSVLSGTISSSLFFSYYSKYAKVDKSEVIKLYVDQAIETINQNKVSPNYYEGLAGAAWTINFLCTEKLIDKEYLESLIEVDEFLFEFCLDRIKSKDFDFFYGGLGYGMYFIERVKYNSSCKDYLRDIIILLDNTKQIEPYGYYWQSSQGVLDKTIDFSLAHGQASLLIFISKIYKLGIETTISKRLLTEICNFISYHKKEINGAYIYPDCIENKNIIHSPFRWCHGVLGIGYALIYAGNTLEDTQLINEAIMVIESQKKSVDYSGQQINSSIMCHGSLGIAHMFNRLYQITNNESFYKNAILWYEYSDKIIESEIEFKFQHDDGSFIEGRGVIDGLEGIGLTLLSAISSEIPNWDKSILLS